MDIFLRFARKTGYLPNHFPTKAYDTRLLFILDGEGEIQFADKTISLSKNTLCYYPAGTQYFPVSSKENPLLFVTVNFDLSAEFKSLKSVMLPVSLSDYDTTLSLMSHENCDYDIFKDYFVLSSAYTFRDLFVEMASEFERNTMISSEIAESLLKCILLKLAEYNHKQENGLYTKIINYISDNYRTVKTNSEIANALNYHPYYINTVFKQCSGTTIHRYIMDFRLKKGAELLISTPKSINEISKETGFENPNHFSKRFFDKFGISPSKFRNSNTLI